MYRYNFPTRKAERQKNALTYWKRQLNKETRSVNCDSNDEKIKAEIAALEAKLKGSTNTLPLEN